MRTIFCKPDASYVGVAYSVDDDSLFQSGDAHSRVFDVFKRHCQKYQVAQFRRAKDKAVRTIVCLGPWYCCKACQKQILEHEDRGRVSRNGSKYCEPCSQQIIQQFQREKGREEYAMKNFSAGG